MRLGEQHPRRVGGGASNFVVAVVLVGQVGNGKFEVGQNRLTVHLVQRRTAQPHRVGFVDERFQHDGHVAEMQRQVVVEKRPQETRFGFADGAVIFDGEVGFGQRIEQEIDARDAPVGGLPEAGERAVARKGEKVVEFLQRGPAPVGGVEGEAGVVAAELAQLPAEAGELPPQNRVDAVHRVGDLTFVFVEIVGREVVDGRAVEEGVAAT